VASLQQFHEFMWLSVDVSGEVVLHHKNNNRHRGLLAAITMRSHLFS